VTARSKIQAFHLFSNVSPTGNVGLEMVTAESKKSKWKNIEELLIKDTE
jgi:hypothetical protein